MNKLTKSRTDRVVAGVAGGLARYLRTDPVLIRLFFVLLALTDGIGLLIYFILALVMPEPSGSSDTAPQGDVESLTDWQSGRSSAVVGGGLILMGGYFLLRTLDVPFVPWVSFSQLWPVLLIVAGVALFRRGRQEHTTGG